MLEKKKNIFDRAFNAQFSDSEDLQVILNTIPGGVFWCRFDDALTLEYTSDGFLSMVGHTRETLASECNNSLAKLIFEEDLAPALHNLNNQLTLNDQKVLEYRLRKRDGSLIWVLDRGRLIENENGSKGFFCILVDITAQKNMTAESFRSLEKLQIIMEQTNDIVLEWSPKKRRVIMSPQWNHIFGKAPGPMDDAFEDYAIKELHVHPEDVPVLKHIFFAQEIPIGGFQDIDIRLKTLADKYSWFQMRTAFQLNSEGKIETYICLLRNIDKEKLHEKDLIKKAERDELTGLYNRGTARNRISEILSSNKDQVHALMILDLDNFKYLNDTKGHLYGDAVLSDFAKSISKIFRSTDVIARYGGDEFIIFLKNIQSVQLAKECADEVLMGAQTLLDYENPEHPFGCSIGISIFPKDATSYETLFQRADEALYKSKELGREKIVIYDPSIISGITLNHEDNFTAIDKIQQSLSDFEYNFVNSSFDMMYESVDLKPAIDLLLEIVGRQYNVSRAYIFEICEEDTTRFSNTFEWCKEEVTPEIDQLQNVPYGGKDGVGGFFDSYDEQGLFYCSDISTLNEAQKGILEAQGIYSVLHCVIKDGDRVLGFVGLDECTEPRYWEQNQVETMVRCARILSVFLSKMRLQEKIKKLTDK